MAQYLPELFVLMIMIILVIQETKKAQIMFHCRRCGRIVSAKNIREGCICKSCYKEVKYDAECRRGL